MFPYRNTEKDFFFHVCSKSAISIREAKRMIKQMHFHTCVCRSSCHSMDSKVHHCKQYQKNNYYEYTSADDIATVCFV